MLVAPYLAMYQLRGDVGVQSEATPGGALLDNSPQSLRVFGQDHHREDVGVRVDIGDGFGGARIDYYRLDMNAPRGGVLGDDWGQLLAGDEVRMNASMDELRIGYHEPVLTLRTTWREQPLTVRFAVGGVFAYRDLDLAARTVDGTRSQSVEIQGDVLYLGARCRVGWRDVALDVEYAGSPEIVLGGDFDNYLQDVEIRLGYTLPLHDVTLFGAYRLSTFEAEGGTGRFAYDADLTLDGFQLGVALSF